MCIRDCFTEGTLSSPFVENFDLARIDSVQYAEQVFQNSLQNTKLELMEQIHDQVDEQIEAEGG